MIIIFICIFKSRKNSAWRIEPSEGIVEPGEEITVLAICYLTDKIK